MSWNFFGGYGSRIFFYFCYLFNGKLSSNLIFFSAIASWLALQIFYHFVDEYIDRICRN